MAIEAGNSADHDVARRLTAVLAADVVGYSRLMANDEVGALNQLKSLRGTVINPLVTRHRGEIVGSAGDSFLIAFASAVDAVACALAWQQDCADAGEKLAADKRMLFRIGIHLGDVIPEGGTIYGDGVNIAARLEKLAQPGAVVVSRAIRDQAEGRLNLAFTDLGRLELKNIPRPVEAFGIRHGETAPKPADQTQSSPGAGAKLSIAILPFANMSGDKEQDYFSDGITEDIITEISRFRELRVIARNSSFAFRGQNVDISEIGRKLGVEFVVEGSVRKAGTRVRITVQLIEADTNRHVWAERYDRELSDVFAVQDEIARTIAGLSAGHAKVASVTRNKARPTESLSAYDMVLRSRAELRQYGVHDAHAEMLKKVLELDPNYALMANSLLQQSFYEYDPERRERAAECARRAIQLDPAEPWGHAMLGYSLTFLHRLPEAEVHFQQALELNPNDTYVIMLHALSLTFTNVDQAISRMQYALTRDPFAHDWFWDDYCMALVVAGRHREALAAFEKIGAPPPWAYALAAIAKLNVGDMKGAKSFLARHDAESKVSAQDLIRSDPWADPTVPHRLISDLNTIAQSP